MTPTPTKEHISTLKNLAMNHYNTQKEPKNPDFYAIGAGLPRTGTLSLMHALEILLPGKCHHMYKAIHHDEEWRDIFAGKMNDKEFKNFFLSRQEVAAVDAPMCFVFERGIKVFPDAKVILTLRDPEDWVKSVKATIFSVNLPTMLLRYLGLFPSYLGDPRLDQKKWPTRMLDAGIKHNRHAAGFGKSIFTNKGVEYFEEWTKLVEQRVPKEQLLKFNVKDGWGPLCEFLDVPEPDVAFPVVNKRDEVKKALATVRRRSWLLVYEIVSLVFWSGFVISKIRI